MKRAGPNLARSWFCWLSWRDGSWALLAWRHTRKWTRLFRWQSKHPYQNVHLEICHCNQQGSRHHHLRGLGLPHCCGSGLHSTVFWCNCNFCMLRYGLSDKARQDGYLTWRVVVGQPSEICRLAAGTPSNSRRSRVYGLCINIRHVLKRISAGACAGRLWFTFRILQELRPLFHQPYRYFDTLWDLNASELLGCTAVPDFMDSARIKNFLDWTGDVEGVRETNGQYSAHCPVPGFWIAPACRQNYTRCIPTLLLEGIGHVFLQWAVAHGI